MDLGSGAGFPGLVVAIVTNEKNIPLKIKLIEKSPKKTDFLKGIINDLKLDVKVLNLNVFELTNKLQADIIVARAFKPLKIILPFLEQKTKKWEKIFLYLGKTGKNDLLLASKSRDIKYKQRMSMTSSDSIIIEINKIKKK